MAIAKAELLFSEPIEQVFQQISRHEDFKLFGPVSSAELIQEGQPTRNGVGAIRKVKAMGVTVVEEVTYFDAPNSYEYKILEALPLLVPKKGKVELTQRHEGTHVLWTSEFTMNIPVAGEAVAQSVALFLSQQLKGLLAAFQRNLKN